MVKLSDLTGIEDNKKKQLIKCLDELLVFKNEKGHLAPIINCYNWYSRLPIDDAAITFSNMHETARYKLAMFQDLQTLGYSKKIMEKRIRQKGGSFFWEPAYRIRDDKGNLLKLSIKDLRNEGHIDLNNCGMTLDESQQFIGSEGYLLAEGYSWELNLPFSNKNDLIAVSNLFLKKSGGHIYNENGIEIAETNEEYIERCHWPDAYKTPVLIIGEQAIRYLDDLPQFDTATKIMLVENDNEISFIIHNRLDFLKSLEYYDIDNSADQNKIFPLKKDLIRLGFL